MKVEIWRLPGPLWWFPADPAVHAPGKAAPGPPWRLSFKVWWKP